MKKMISWIICLAVWMLPGTGALAMDGIMATPEPLVDKNDLGLDLEIIRPRKTRILLTQSGEMKADGYRVRIGTLGIFDEDTIAGYASENEYEYVFASLTISNDSPGTMDLDALVHGQLIHRDAAFDADIWNVGLLEPMLSGTLLMVFRVPQTVLQAESAAQSALVFRLGETEYEAPLDSMKRLDWWPLAMAISTGDNLYDAPEGESIKGTGEGDRVYALEVGVMDWCKVIYGGTVGYVPSENLVYPRMGTSIDNVQSNTLEPGPPTVPRSVWVKAVSMNSPAERAGLQAGDLIMYIDGQRVTTTAEQYQIVRGCVYGETVELTICRMRNHAYNEAADTHDYDWEYVTVHVRCEFLD